MNPSCAAAHLAHASLALAIALDQARAADLPLRLENLASRPVAASYAAPPDATRYSAHPIAHAPIGTNETADLVLRDVVGCRFNVMVVFSDGVALERRGLDLCAAATLAVFNEGLFLRP